MNRGLCREPVTAPAVAYLVQHLRARDHAEIFGLRWDDDLDGLVRDVVGSVGDGRFWNLWTLDGEPIAVNGATPVRPGVVSLASFGTDLWHHAADAIIRHAYDVLSPALRATYVHRAEAYSLAANGDTSRFITALGGEPEGLLREFGRNREDYVLWAWRVDDVLLGRRRGIERPAKTILPG